MNIAFQVVPSSKLFVSSDIASMGGNMLESLISSAYMFGNISPLIALPMGSSILAQSFWISQEMAQQEDYH
jgi:hypothetical protein